MCLEIIIVLILLLIIFIFDLSNSYRIKDLKCTVKDLEYDDRALLLRIEKMQQDKCEHDKYSYRAVGGKGRYRVICEKCSKILLLATELKEVETFKIERAKKILEDNGYEIKD